MMPVKAHSEVFIMELIFSENLDITAKGDEMVGPPGLEPGTLEL